MKPTLIISLDFELFWGMQDCVPIEQYQENVLGGRKAIPALLALFEKYDIHATWATVGFQFAGNRSELSEMLPPEEQRPTYENSAVSTYRCLDAIGETEAEAPCFFAQSLLRQISGHPGQEIGSHTFSHYYCLEKGQTPQQFEADMRAAQKMAERYGIQLRSVVFPRNQSTPECVEVLRKLGFTAYRDLENDWIHKKIPVRILKRACTLLDMYLPLIGFGTFLPKEENGIVNVMGSRMYRPYFRPLGFLEWLKLARIKGEMRHAAKHGLCYHLWWHPHNLGLRTEYHLQQLEELFAYYEKLQKKYGMCSANMAEAAEEWIKETDSVSESERGRTL